MPIDPAVASVVDLLTSPGLVGPGSPLNSWVWMQLSLSSSLQVVERLAGAKLAGLTGAQQREVDQFWRRLGELVNSVQDKKEGPDITGRAKH